jgi:AraC-like DNA-binding protein
MSSQELVATHRETAIPLEPWLDKVRDAYVELDFKAESTGVFRGSLAAFQLGEVMLGDVAHDAMQVSRTQQGIAQDHVQFYKVSLQLDGYSILEQNGRETVVAPGDLTVYDTSNPFVITTNQAARSLILTCPHDRLGIANELMGNLVATRMSGRSGLGSVTSAYLAQLGSGLSDGSVKSSRQLEDSVLSVLRTLFNDELEKVYSNGTEEQMLTYQILAGIEANLSDPDLSVASIAAEHFISTRQLQRIFQQRGTTVTRWIRERRLNRCREELLQRGSSVKNVRDVALQWGIQDAAHFSRIFRDTFGQSPSEYRLEHQRRGTPV